MRPPLRVIAVGPLPPPPGGVASSLQSLVDATEPRDDIEVTVIRWKQMWKLLLMRPDVLHLHFSKPVKRLMGTLLGKIVGAKVAHTVHSNNFDFSSRANRLAARLAEGMILLNTDIMQRFRDSDVANCVMMTPILALEDQKLTDAFDADLEEFLNRQSNKICVVYTHDKREVDGYDIYGINFVVDLLPRLNELGWSVIFLDPFAFYTRDAVIPEGCTNAFLQSSHVDFNRLLVRSDAYLRPTATDGNSVAVLEALAAGVPVIASDIVPRPDGVQLFCFRDCASFLEQLTAENTVQANTPKLTSAQEYVDFLHDLWGKSGEAAQ